MRAGRKSVVTDSFVSLVFGGAFGFGFFVICSFPSHVRRSKSKSLIPYDLIVVLQTMSKSFKIQKKTHRKKKSLFLAFYRSHISHVASSL